MKPSMLTAREVIASLGLAPHPEGGFFVETFRAPALPVPLPGRGPRSASTAIYFLLETHDFSALHVVDSDEAWHHYLGDPIELTCFDREHRLRSVQLGPALERGQRPQHVVQSGELQAARVLAGPHGFALCGCTVAPGFDFADFRMPPRAQLLAELSDHHDLVLALTRP